MKKTLFGLVLILSLVIPISSFAVSFDEWVGGDYMNVYLVNDKDSTVSIPYDLTNFIKSINHSVTPGENPPLKGIIQPGQTLEFTTLLPSDDSETPYNLWHDESTTNGYYFNYKNTDNSNSSPVINGMDIPLHLWGTDAQEKQYINMITGSAISPYSNSSYHQTVKFYNNTLVRLSAGGFHRSMHHVFFTVTCNY